MRANISSGGSQLSAPAGVVCGLRGVWFLEEMIIFNWSDLNSASVAESHWEKKEK